VKALHYHQQHLRRHHHQLQLFHHRQEFLNRHYFLVLVFQNLNSVKVFHYHQLPHHHPNRQLVVEWLVLDLNHFLQHRRRLMLLLKMVMDQK
jgi:hypothetical protein